MEVCATDCKHHEKIAGDVARHDTEIKDLDKKQDAHAANGGKGHVTRYEFDELKKCVVEMRSILIKLGIGILLLSGGGSAFGPDVRAFIGKLFGG